MEIRKDIKGYEGKYQISSLGRIKSLGRYWENPMNHNKTTYIQEKIVLPQIRSKNRPFIYLGKGIIKRLSVSRLVAQAFLGLDIEDTKTNVCHKDDDPFNNNKDNLFLGTTKDNIHDMMSKKRDKFFGGTRKLTKEKIIQIKSMYSRGMSTKEKKEIANIYGISVGCVRNIMYGTSEFYKRKFTDSLF